MALINIDYGSLASSETLNSNFLYLENKISNNTESIMTNIASIMSNIATINSRLSEIAEALADSDLNLNNKIDSYKSKTNLLFLQTGMCPDWSSCSVFDYTVNTDMVMPSNGFLLFAPATTGRGTVTINGVSVTLKLRNSADDNASMLIPIPVQKDDVVNCAVPMSNVYFVPAIVANIEDF